MANQPASPPGTTTRFISPDGQHSVRRIGLERRVFGDVYHFLMVTSWPRLLGLIVSVYVVTNSIFGLGYFLDAGGVENARPGSYSDAFFFSVQTLATVGYGRMSPVSTFAHVLVTAETILGMLIVAVSTGIIFAKFSRPTARVLFSKIATIYQRDGQPSLVFRVANERANLIVDANMRVVVLRDQVTSDGERVRRVFDLPLVRSQNSVFALTWMAIHVIDEKSPLHGARSMADLEAERMEIVASLVGIDGTMSQTVHARAAWSWADVRFDRRFVDIFSSDGHGRLIDYAKFHDVEPAPQALVFEKSTNA